MLRSILLLPLCLGCVTVRGGSAPLEATPEHIYVQAKVNGYVPFTFLVSTGAEQVFISHALAQQLGLDVWEVAGRKETVFHLDRDTNAGLTRVSTLEVGDAMVPNLLVGVWGVERGGPEERERAKKSTERPIDGVLGYGFLRQFRVTLDYPASKVVLETL
jgi:hypothetical protein